MKGQEEMDDPEQRQQPGQRAVAGNKEGETRGKRGEYQEQTQEHRQGGDEEEGPFDDGVERGRRAPQENALALPTRRAPAPTRREEVPEGAPAPPGARQPKPFQQDEESGGHAVRDVEGQQRHPAQGHGDAAEDLQGDGDDHSQQDGQGPGIAAFFRGGGHALPPGAAQSEQRMHCTS